MQTRIEALLFGAIAFLMAAMTLAGLARLAYPDAISVDTGRQLSGATECPVPATASTPALEADKSSTG